MEIANEESHGNFPVCKTMDIMMFMQMLSAKEKEAVICTFLAVDRSTRASYW